jgi:hypothetical protein
MARTALIGAVAACLLAGCSSPPAYIEADPFYFGNRPQDVSTAYASAEMDDSVNALIGIDKLLSAAILAGDWTEAERLATIASARVNIFLGNQKGERDALSFMGREKSKPFKGEPHERAMVDFYLGLLRYRRGEFEGALNGFLSAMDKVRGTYQLPVEKSKARKGAENEETFLFENRYATFAFFAALCFSRVDEPAEAARHLAMAQETRPEMAGLFEAGLDPENNVIAVIEVGRAPAKVGTGPRKEILTYRRGTTGQVQEVLVGDSPLGFGMTEDLYVQATNLGGRSVDELNKVKARRQEALQAAGYVTAMAGGILAMAGDAHKNKNLQYAGLAVLAVGIGTIIFSEMAIDPSADVRAWSTLPGAIYIAVGRAPPGDHDVVVRARGGSGDDESQHWTGVPIAERDNLLWFRLLPNRKGGPYQAGPAARGEVNHRGTEKTENAEERSDSDR